MIALWRSRWAVWMILAVCRVIGYQLGPHVSTPVGHFSGLALIYTFFAAIVLAMRTSHRNMDIRLFMVSSWSRLSC